MNFKIEIAVGFFMLLVMSALIFLCLKVVSPTSFSSTRTYDVVAVFDNIGGLKERAPIKIGGVVIGRVSGIQLQKNNNDVYKPHVTMSIETTYDQIPSSSQFMIKTTGLLGEQFIDLNIGIGQELITDIDALSLGGNTNDAGVQNQNVFLKNGSRVTNTQSAIQIEDLIGQFIYNSK